MRKFVFGLFLMSAIFMVTSCSSEEDFDTVSPVEMPVSRASADSDKGTPISVSKLIEKLNGKCSEYEMEYLRSLSPDAIVYIQKDISKFKYTKVDASNISALKELASGKFTVEKLEPEPIFKDSGISTYSNISYRTGVIGIERYNSFIEGDINILADISYAYDYDTSCVVIGYPCTIKVSLVKASGQLSLLLNWEDSGSTATATGLFEIAYSVVGSIKLGTQVGDLVIGTPIDNVVEGGSMLVGW